MSNQSSRDLWPTFMNRSSPDDLLDYFTDTSQFSRLSKHGTVAILVRCHAGRAFGVLRQSSHDSCGCRSVMFVFAEYVLICALKVQELLIREANLEDSKSCKFNVQISFHQTNPCMHAGPSRRHTRFVLHLSSHGTYASFGFPSWISSRTARMKPVFIRQGEWK